MISRDLAPQIWAADAHRLGFDEAAFTAKLGPNHLFDPPALRVHYSSMTTPRTLLEYDVANRRRGATLNCEMAMLEGDSAKAQELVRGILENRNESHDLFEQ